MLPLHEADISVRLYNHLKAQGINDLEFFIGKDLTLVHEIGKLPLKSYGELVMVLNQNKFEFKPSEHFEKMLRQVEARKEIAKLKKIEDQEERFHGMTKSLPNLIYTSLETINSKKRMVGTVLEFISEISEYIIAHEDVPSDRYLHPTDVINEALLRLKSGTY